MQTIYEPKGKAREYAPLACNLYVGCSHGCRYCYGPTIPNPAKKGLTMEQWRKEWHSVTMPKANLLAKLDADCRSMYRNGDTRPVLLCFACDPYPPDEPCVSQFDWTVSGDDCAMTQSALLIMKNSEVTPIILTKGGTRACRDFDVLKAAGGWFGQTIAFLSEEAVNQWEPNAVTLDNRYQAAHIAADMGMHTWASVEPVIDPREALWVLCGSTFDHLKLGKLNGYDAETRAIERSIDWPAYREESRRILNAAGYREIAEPGVFEVGTYYVKRELREAV